MSILKVAKLGHPILSKVADDLPISSIKDAKVQSLIDDMVATMREYGGVGLAAPQVHNSIKIIVIESELVGLKSSRTDLASAFINPVLKDFSTTMLKEWEGCLSLGELLGKVSRADKVTVEGFNDSGNKVKIEAEGYLARVFQHEIDHLYGKLVTHRVEDMSDLSFRAEFSRYHQNDYDADEINEQA
ncbi:MAG: peptide deformylase [Nitrospinota bacterium]